MLKLKYLNNETTYNVIFSQISPNVVQLLGEVPFNSSGFVLTRFGENDNWEYLEYTTLYREIGGGLQLSNDGSVYEPQEPETTPEPEPYVPTFEEVKSVKRQEIAAICEQVIYTGIDVELSDGIEHFSLTEKDQINLFGKRAQMVAGAEKFEYHQNGHPCRYYTMEEMQKIIETALGFITYQTTYCNALNMWIAAAEDKEEVNSIVYGCDVPEEYQSEVLRDLLIKRNVEE